MTRLSQREPRDEHTRDVHEFLSIRLTSGEQSKDQWRKSLLYEYYWEWNFPHTPTMFALRREDFKLIQYHGIWDTDELYDLKNDPREKKNLIRDPGRRELVAQMRTELHSTLKNSVHFKFRSARSAETAQTFATLKDRMRLIFRSTCCASQRSSVRDDCSTSREASQ